LRCLVIATAQLRLSLWAGHRRRGLFLL